MKTCLIRLPIECSMSFNLNTRMRECVNACMRETISQVKGIAHCSNSNINGLPFNTGGREFRTKPLQYMGLTSEIFMYMTQLSTHFTQLFNYMTSTQETKKHNFGCRQNARKCFIKFFLARLWFATELPLMSSLLN